jgi:hypothetical protein
MTRLGVTIAILVGCAGAFFAGFVGGTKTAFAAEPCALVEPAPIDAQVWLYRGLDACVSQCGTAVPFDVEVEPQRVRCNCGRPPNVGVKR